MIREVIKHKNFIFPQSGTLVDINFILVRPKITAPDYITLFILCIVDPCTKFCQVMLDFGLPWYILKVILHKGLNGFSRLFSWCVAQILFS
jgi:hypothetical protein